MEYKQHTHQVYTSDQFRDFSKPPGYSERESSYSARSMQPGGVYYQQNTAYLHQINQHGAARNQGGYQPSEADLRNVYLRRKEGLKKLRNVGVFNIILAVLTIAVGLATLIVASENIGFPVFNFGVLFVGILHLIVGILCFLAGRNGLTSILESDLEVRSTIKCYIIAQFSLSVAIITFAILAAVFAFLSGAVCAGADINFQSRNNGRVTELDVKQYCEPNKDTNAILAFVGGGLCMLIAFISIYGSIWVCCYGRLFGWKRRGGRFTYTGATF